MQEEDQPGSRRGRRERRGRRRGHSESYSSSSISSGEEEEEEESADQSAADSAEEDDRRGKEAQSRRPLQQLLAADYGYMGNRWVQFTKFRGFQPMGGGVTHKAGEEASEASRSEKVENLV